MKFLVVLVVFILYRHYLGENLLQRYFSLNQFLKKLQAYGTIVGVSLGIIVPVLITIWITCFYAGFAALPIWFVVSVLILLYGVDIFDNHVIYSQHREQLLEISDNTSLSEVPLSEVPLSEVPLSEVPLSEVIRQQEIFFQETLERLFRAFIPVFFWFLCLGPWAALSYLLITRYHDIVASDNTLRAILGRLIFFMDFIPVRLTALLFAFLGSFGPCFDLWLVRCFDTRLQFGTYLSELAIVAIGRYDKSVGEDAASFIKLSETQLTEVLDLWQRTLYGWLGIAAIVTIIGF